MRLFIAEKPDLAKTIVEKLGARPGEIPGYVDVMS